MIVAAGLIDLGSHTFDLHYATEADIAAALPQPADTAQDHRARVHDEPPVGMTRRRLGFTYHAVEEE